MTLVLIEGFDHFSRDEIAMKGWSGTGLGMTTGRMPYGPQSQAIVAAIINNGTGKTLNSTITTGVMGYGFKSTNIASGKTFSHLSGSGSLVSVGYSGISPSRLAIYDNTGTEVGTGINIVYSNTWNYIEIKVSSSTTASLQLNGLTEISSVTGSFGNSFSSVSFEYQVLGGNSISVDDLYVLDLTGGINNDFLGDIVVETLYPISDGTYTDWTVDIGGAHWPRVSEYIMDQDTSYVHTTTVGAKDSYGAGNPTLTNTPVYGVQLNLAVRKNDAGTRVIQPLIRQSGTDYLGTSHGVTVPYLFFSQLYNQDPSGSSWLYSTVNNDEYGIKMVS